MQIDRIDAEYLCQDMGDLNSFGEDETELRFPEPVQPSLNDTIEEYLASINVLDSSHNYGVDIYQRALTFINENST